jgi:hypothetical protein
VKHGDVLFRILQPTCSALKRLLIHTISITTSMVTVVQRQRSCGVLADSQKSNSSMVLKLGFDFRIDEDYDF